jgi:histidinol-phosphate/aromatic aminotransferase/cobyric acid decarboxylase-like protein
VIAAITAHRPAVTMLDRPGLRCPTWTADEVREVAGACRAVGGLLVVDETCASYLPPGDSLIRLTDDVAGLVVLRSMSKGWCCGGLRIGFAVAAPDVAPLVRAVLAPLAGAAITLDVALALLRLPDPLAPLRARIADAKPEATALLTAAGCPPLATDPAVPWMVLPPDAGPLLAARGLTPKNVPARDPEGHLLRVAVPLSDQRRAVLATALHPVALEA